MSLITLYDQNSLVGDVLVSFSAIFDLQLLLTFLISDLVVDDVGFVWSFFDFYGPCNILVQPYLLWSQT